MLRSLVLFTDNEIETSRGRRRRRAQLSRESSNQSQGRPSRHRKPPHPVKTERDEKSFVDKPSLEDKVDKLGELLVQRLIMSNKRRHDITTWEFL